MCKNATILVLVASLYGWMRGRVWIGYNEKDCLPRNPQTNIL